MEKMDLPCCGPVVTRRVKELPHVYGFDFDLFQCGKCGRYWVYAWMTVGGWEPVTPEDVAKMQALEGDELRAFMKTPGSWLSGKRPEGFVIRRAAIGDAATLAAFAARAFEDAFGAHNAAAGMSSYVAEAYGIRQQTSEIENTNIVTLLVEHETRADRIRTVARR